jgi:Ca-activated chloride channel homolog
LVDIPFLFIHPKFLILIPIILVIWYILGRERYGYIIPNDLMEKYLRTPWIHSLLWIVRILLISSLIGIIAVPYRIQGERVVERDQNHILIVLDLSRSMLAEDITPSRIEWAREAIWDIIRSRNGENVWLIVFAGKAFDMIPASTDYTWLSALIEHIGVDTIRQDKSWLSGTAIGDALLLASLTLSGSLWSRSIILLTDGRANIGIDPRLTLPDIESKGIKIYTIGIGSQSGQVSSYTDKSTGQKVILLDERWDPVKSDIDEWLLRELAKKTGGSYTRIGEGRDFSAMIAKLQESMIRDQKSVIEKRNIYYDLPLAIISLVLMILCLPIEILYRRRLGIERIR